MDQPKEKKRKKGCFLSEQYFVALSEELYYLLTEYCGEVRNDLMENLKTKSQISFSVCHWNQRRLSFCDD